MALVFAYDLPKNLNESCKVVSRKDTFETENSNLYNISKFSGTVAKLLHYGNLVIVDDPDSFITKNNKNELLGNIYRKTDAKFNIYCCSKNIINNICYKKYDLINDVNDLIISNHLATKQVKYTGGINASFDNNTGHITTFYGISCPKEKEISSFINNLLPQLNYNFQGQKINIETSNDNINFKAGGSVVYVPELINVFNNYDPEKQMFNVQKPHITCNTTIKAVLSTEIINMFEKGISSFMLKDIEPNTKQILYIRLVRDNDVSVKLTSYYSYLLD
ncbi:hypothetical protein Hokovirus_4_56 [Hokovirus HKV1]|uniref:Uncharacterized protein n=1 Tax=Hokovirus HKV1 TaxID=1977638 RepID=A0A1V0SH85_9VIRU|nr:hypothetical protein Hokovirus_4_56 [Hokovirus HKV1]